MQAALAHTILVTGATGFLGSHFLFAQRNSPLHFVLLVRAGDEAHAWERVRAALETTHAAYRLPFNEAHWRTRCTPVLGDIEEPMCGVAAARIDWLRTQSIGQLWHFAASLNYEEQNRDLIQRQNVDGTRHVIGLAQAVSVRSVVHCSTAYSAGCTKGRVAEALHTLPRPFNNAYEESKCIGEHEVRSACEAAGIAWAILRPSIVIGPRSTRSSGGTKSGLYGFLGSLHRMRAALSRVDHPIVVNGNPHTRLNLIPVDDLMADLAHLPMQQITSGTILHLTSDGYPDLAWSLRHVSTLLGIPPLEIRPVDPDNRSPLEKLLDRRTEFHSSYINSEIEFDRSLPQRHAVSNLDFAGFIAEAFREFSRESSHDVFTAGTVTGFDGTVLRSLSRGNGGRPAIVVVNALGMGAEFWTRFAKLLAQRYDVVTWEGRGGTSEDSPFDTNTHSFGHHVRDLMAILDHHGITQAHLVGWCSGAQIALKAACEQPERVLSVVALNGSYGTHDPACTTAFERRLRDVMPKIARDPRLAEIYFNLVYGNRQTTGVDESDLSHQKQQASSILASVDPDLMHLTSRPYESPGALHRYATLLSASLQENTQEWLNRVRVPVLVYAGANDQVAHPDASRWVAHQLSQSRLLLDETGDHFSFYRDDTVSRLIADRIDSLTSARALESSA